MDEAEAKDGEVGELHRKQREVRAVGAWLAASWARGCSKSAGRMHHLGQGLLGEPCNCCRVNPASTFPEAQAALSCIAALLFENHFTLRLCPLPPSPTRLSALTPCPPARPQVKAGHAELRELCGLMSGQMGRFKGLLEYARRGAEDLTDRVAAAEEELAQLRHRADGRAEDVRRGALARAAAHADKALLAGQLAAARCAASAAAEAADGVGIEHALLARGAAESGQGMEALAARRAAALAAKAATQAALLERNEEMVGLFERSAALQRELDSGGWCREGLARGVPLQGRAWMPGAC